MSDGHVLEDSLVSALVECGRQAHEVAMAHQLDPGSNGFTFGADRYHRATELITPVLEEHGFVLKRQGGGMTAHKDGLELQFATARGVDLRNRSHFDMGSSPARHRAALANTYLQDSLPGIDAGGAESVIHVIWSGDVHAGLTAVYVGKLISSSAQHLEWEDLIRVDHNGNEVPLGTVTPTEIPVRSYDEQATPGFDLGLLEQPRTHER
jgi:hypothetical protein